MTLTKRGHRLLKRNSQLPDDQAIYYGLVNSREARHDADLYRLYQKEVARIERSGGRPVRIILDYEIKRKTESRSGAPGRGKGQPRAQARNCRKTRARWSTARFPCLICASNTKAPNSVAARRSGARNPRIPAAIAGRKSQSRLRHLWPERRRIASPPHSRRARTHREIFTL